jgi:hypothetical protein
MSLIARIDLRSHAGQELAGIGMGAKRPVELLWN